MAKKRRPKSKNYFTHDTELAIVRYNNEPNPEVRSKIYEDEIHYPFFKLTENIIHTFKFYYTEVDEIEHLQHEVITFLLSKMHLFDPAKGAKAYSYFGTICKNYLIVSNTKNYKKRIDKADVVEAAENEKFSYHIDDNPDRDELSEFIDLFVEYVEERIYKLFPKKNDAEVADAILEIFRKREDISSNNDAIGVLYWGEPLPIANSFNLSPKCVDTEAASNLFMGLRELGKSK